MTFEPETLEAVEDDLWRRLARAVADRRADMRWATLATVDPDGAPSARTVVLRRACASERSVEFHTDARASKSDAIAAEPRVALVALDRRAHIPVRLTGRAARLDTAAEDAVWASLSPGARVVYGQVEAPGVEIAGADAARERNENAARAQFRAVAFHVERAEWLHLAEAGHRRAVIAYGGDAAPRRAWIAP